MNIFSEPMACVLLSLKVYFHEQKILIFMNTSFMTQEIFAYPKVAKINPVFSPGSFILLAVLGLGPCSVSAKKCVCGMGLSFLVCLLVVALIFVVKAFPSCVNPSPYYLC